jgi:hypothetical protein
LGVGPEAPPPSPPPWLSFWKGAGKGARAAFEYGAITLLAVSSLDWFLGNDPFHPRRLVLRLVVIGLFVLGWAAFRGVRAVRSAKRQGE